jgi:hypothetical protein
MPTQLKSDAARANGAKSQGPKTAQGREISSRNSTKHGLSARNPLVLECENADDFQAVHDSQMEIHQPATPAERDLVDQMVAARWRILRLQSIESGLLDKELRRRKDIERRLDSGRVIQLSDAYTTQANDSRAMALASRHESRLNRMYQSSYKVLRELQASRLKESKQPATPEPALPRAAEPAKAEPGVHGPAEKNAASNPECPDAGPSEIRNPLSPGDIIVSSCLFPNSRLRT